VKIHQEILKSYVGVSPLEQAQGFENVDVIDSLKINSNTINKKNIIIETELVLMPHKTEDASLCRDSSNHKKIIIELHKPVAIDAVDESTLAEKLNGLQWKGWFKLHTRAIKVSFNDLFFTANIDKHKECFLAINNIDASSIIVNNDDCGDRHSCRTNKLTKILLKKNNEWIDVNYKFPVIERYLSKKDNTYALHSLREDLEGCKLNIIQKNALGILGGLTDSCDKAKKAFGIK